MTPHTGFGGIKLGSLYVCMACILPTEPFWHPSFSTFNMGTIDHVNLRNGPQDLMAITKTDMHKQEHAIEMMEWVFSSIEDTLLGHLHQPPCKEHTQSAPHKSLPGKA